jgi:ribosomal protein S18 acetylase RimI-like enzyme
VRPASRKELPRILEIQKAAFRAECELTGDWGIEPMAQTLAGVEEDFEGSAVLVAAGPGGAILGSVRAARVRGSVYVFRLSVDPARRRLGAGRSLMLAAELALPSPRYFLRTRKGNGPAEALYLNLGYRVYKEEDGAGGIRFAFFEKHAEGNGAP